MASTTVTNITGNIAAFTTGFINTLNSTLATITTLFGTTSNFVTSNASTTNATTTNATNANFTTLTSTGSTSLASTTAQGRLIAGSIISTSTLNVLGTTTLSTSTIASTTITTANIANLNISGISTSNSTITNSTSTNLFTTDENVINSSTTNLTAVNSTFTSATSTKIFATNASITNSTSTNIFSVLANLTSATIATLNSTIATITTIFGTTSNFVTSNASTTNASTSNFITTNTTNLIGTRATLTNATVTNLRATGNVTLDSGMNVSGLLNVNGAIVMGTNASIQNDTGFNMMQFSALGSNNGNNVINFGVDDNGPLDYRFLTSTSEFNFTNEGRLGININPQNALHVASSTGGISGIRIGVSSTSASVFTTNKFLAVNASGDIVLATSSTDFTELTGLQATLTSATTTNFSTNGLVAATSSITNLNVLTNLFANVLNAVTGTITTLWGTTGNFLTLNASTTNATTSNVVNIIGINATFTNSTSTNLFATNENIINSSTTNLTAVNATLASATSTNVFTTNLRADNASFTIATTSNLVVNGATTLGTLALTNLASNGNITSAANIDAYTVFNLNQTTVNIIPTIPNPTNTTAGKIIYVNNVGTVSFQMSSTQIAPSTGRAFMWTGSAWSLLNEVLGGGTQIKTETTAQSNNTVTLANETNLSFTIGANETIVFIYELLVTNMNSATPDFKAAILGPAGSTCNVSMSGDESLGAGFPQASTTNCTTPGTLINNNIAADVFIPYQVRIQGTITSGVTAGTVNLQFAQNSVAAGNPIKIMPGSMLHAYKATGADLAEIYYAVDSSIKEGDVVSIAGTGQSQIEKTSKKYQSNSLGIVSTKPGIVMADTDGSGKPVLVALSGRVPVKVTGENGSIKAGDFITAGSVAGHAMRASDSGQVIGQALNDFVATSTESKGVIMLFIKNQYYDGGEDKIQTSTSTLLADGSIADRFTHLLRLAFEKITNVFLDMTLWIKNVKTDKVQTKELCIDDVCVTKEQLQQMLINNSNNQNNNLQNNTPLIIAPTPTSTDPIPDPNPITTDPEPVPDPAPTSDQPPTTEPAAENPPTTTESPL